MKDVRASLFSLAAAANESPETYAVKFLTNLYNQEKAVKGYQAKVTYRELEELPNPFAMALQVNRMMEMYKHNKAFRAASGSLGALLEPFIAQIDAYIVKK